MDMFFRDDPATRLKRLMAEHDINTQELAYKANLSMNTVSRLRTGIVTKPTYRTARSVARVFGVKITDIWPDLKY
jgi:DNA-binding XRE family transcriptional regulator